MEAKKVRAACSVCQPFVLNRHSYYPYIQLKIPLLTRPSMKNATITSDNNEKYNSETNQQETEQESNSSLNIVSSQGQELTKNQDDFNQLITEVERLNKKLLEDGQTLENLLQAYTRKVPELQKKFAEGQLTIAKLLDSAADSHKFDQQYTGAVRNVILWFCDKAFQQINPEDEGKELYTRWADTSYEESLEKQGEALIEAIARDMKGRYGMEVDVTGIQATPEGFAQLQERIAAQLRQQQEQQRTASDGSNTEKQILNEHKEKELDEEKLKSLRSIYIALAKMLHPDTATDPAEKLRKEELMKRVSVAYREKDLPALLKLELEFVAAETSHLQSLADEKLNVYITALKEQVTTLKHQLYALRTHPRFAGILHLAAFEYATALTMIKAYEEKLELQVKEAERARDFLENNPEKKEVLEFVLSVAADIR